MAELLHGKITEGILSCFYRAGNRMGHGFLESVYQKIMYFELTEHGMDVRSKVWLPVRYCGRLVGDFEADLVVEVGLILNFGPSLEFRRLVFENKRKVPAEDSPRPPK